MAITLLPGGFIDASKYGVVPGVDCTAAFQALATNMPKNSTILLPPGGLQLSAMVEFYTGVKNASHTDHIWIKGAGAAGSQGTTISGTFDGPLVSYNYAGVNASSTARIKGISFQNFHPTGTGLQLERVDNSIIDDCSFGPAHRGLVIGAKQKANVDVTLRDVYLNGDHIKHPDGIGAALSIKGNIYSIKGFRWGNCAAQLSHTIGVFGGHFEVSRMAVRLGIAPDGSAWNTQASLHQVVCEGNTTGLEIAKLTTSCELYTFTDQGHANLMTQNSLVGIDVLASAGRLTMTNCAIAGNYTIAGVRLGGDKPVVIINSQAAGNKVPPLTPGWLSTMDPALITSIQSDTPAGMATG